MNRIEKETLWRVFKYFSDDNIVGYSFSKQLLVKCFVLNKVLFFYYLSASNLPTSGTNTVLGV